MNGKDKELSTHIPAIRFKGFSGEWEKIELGDITSKIGSGKTPKGGNSTYVFSGIPLLRSQNIYNNLVNLNDVAYITPYTHEEMKNSNVLKNDVLLNITGASIGRSAIYSFSGEANVNQHVCIIRLIEGYNSKFTQLYLASSKGQQQIDNNQAGGAREGLNFQHIGRMSFVFAPLNEQTKIGNYFQQLDTLITQHQKKHDKLLNLKKSLLKKMFPKQGINAPEIRFKEFSGAWEEKTLGDLCTVITKGTTPLNKSGNGSINFIKIENINSLSGEISVTTKIKKEEHESYLKRSKLLENDILFSIAGTLGRIAIVDKNLLPANTNQALAIIRLKKGNIKYITTYLKGRAVSDYIKKNPTVGAQPNLSLEQVEKIELSLPKIKEQTKIGNLFKHLDTLLNQHQTQLKKLNNIKQACLAKMFV